MFALRPGSMPHAAAATRPGGFVSIPEPQTGSRRLRVVMVEHSHVLGGIERHVAGLLCGLAGRGHAVAFAGPLDGWLGQTLLAQGIACEHLPMTGMYDLRSAVALGRFCKRFGADLIHGHAQRGARYAAWVAGRLHVAAVATAHSTTAWKHFGRETRLIGVSDAVCRFLLSRGIEERTLQRVYPGVAEPRTMRPPPGHESSIPTTTLRLGMVARLVPDKGHDVALTALAQVLQHQPARLVIAGATDTEWAARMQELAVQLGVDRQVDFLGERNDVPQLMADMDLLLAPSRREALSLTLLEACGAGLPVVGSQVGGIPEVVVHRHSGLLVQPGDAEALAAAILRLSCPELRRSYGLAARERYEALFTADAMLDGTERVYRQAMACAAGERP